MPVGQSYDFNHKIRDVNEVWEMLVQGNINTLLNRIVFSKNAEITNRKMEWVDDLLTPTSGILNADSNSGSGTIVLDGVVPIRVGSILRFEASDETTKTVQVLVTDVVIAANTTLTVTRPYGGTVDENLLIGDKAHLISTPQQEGSESGEGEVHQADINYNYTQIFDRIAELTKTAAVSKTYDKSYQFNRQIAIQIEKMLWDVENAMIFGRRVLPTSLATGSMGGILQYITDAGKNIDTSGGAIGETKINNLIENILDYNGFTNGFMGLVVNFNQARKITALNTTGANPVIMKQDTPAQRIGQYVTKFVGDIPVENGTLVEVFVNQRMPKDQALLINYSKIQLKTMRGLTDENAAANGADLWKRRLLMEISLEIKNAGEAHGLMTGLDV
jgi:hypothetical protein